MARDPMRLPLEKLGTVYGRHRATIDPDLAKAYAAATNDHDPAHLRGRWAPPVFGAVATRGALARAVTDVVPSEAIPTALHGEQDMHFHRRLAGGQAIVTTAEAHSVRVGRSGTRFTVRLATVDAHDGHPVLDQWVTLLLPGMTWAGGGPEKPPHPFPGDARRQPVADRTFRVDGDQNFRYADASDDHMPVHLDDDHAKSAGFPGIVLHGLCTLAMAGQVVVGAVGGGDAGRLRRLAVRFCGPVFPGDEICVAIYGSSEGAGRDRPRLYHFEASAGRGRAVLSHGLAEIGG